MRRTSYAGETNNSLGIERFGASSTSEPKLYRRQTLIRNKNRVSYADNCKIDGEEAEFRPTNKRLRKMKAQSKKTFKFRKNRRREVDEQSPDKENVNLTTSSVRESATTSTNTVTTMTASTSKSSGLKPVSLTATVIRRAKQRKKSAHNKASVEIFIDDDSISSTRTSSTMGYRDSFGENDDGCFHLLERYDDSTAVMRLLQSRQRSAATSGSGPETILMEEAVTPIVELDTEQEEEEEEDDTEMNNFVIFEHQDENTLI